MFHYLARRLEKNHCLAAHMGNSRVLAHTQTPIFCVCIYINMYIYISPRPCSAVLWVSLSGNRHQKQQAGKALSTPRADFSTKVSLCVLFAVIQHPGTCTRSPQVPIKSAKVVLFAIVLGPGTCTRSPQVPVKNAKVVLFAIVWGPGTCKFLGITKDFWNSKF